jgi:hypothetical protein
MNTNKKTGCAVSLADVTPGQLLPQDHRTLAKNEFGNETKQEFSREVYTRRCPKQK